MRASELQEDSLEKKVEIGQGGRLMTTWNVSYGGKVDTACRNDSGRLRKDGLVLRQLE